MISKGGEQIIKQIIVRLPDEIHQKLKVKVSQDNTSIQDVLYNSIIEYIEGADDEGIRDSLMEISGCIQSIKSMSDIAKNALKKVSSKHNFVIYSSDDFVSESEKK